MDALLSAASSANEGREIPKEQANRAMRKEKVTKLTSS